MLRPRHKLIPSLFLLYTAGISLKASVLRCFILVFMVCAILHHQKYHYVMVFGLVSRKKKHFFRKSVRQFALLKMISKQFLCDNLDANTRKKQCLRQVSARCLMREKIYQNEHYMRKNWFKRTFHSDLKNHNFTDEESLHTPKNICKRIVVTQ